MEFHEYDVDGMLSSMTIQQFQEWQAFFRIREEKRKEDAAARKNGTAQWATTTPTKPNEFRAVNANLSSFFDAYQMQWDKGVRPKDSPGPQARRR